MVPVTGGRTGLAGLLAGLALVLAAAGCAPGPQSVRPAPTAAIEERPEEPPSGELALRVIDRRPSPVLGYRDEGRGVTLRTEGDLAAAVREGLAEALEEQGLQVLAWDGEADRRLTVNIRSLDYQRSGGFLSRRVRLRSQWWVQGRIDGAPYTAEVAASAERRALFGPGEAQNRKLVDRVLARGIRQLATSSELLRLLQGE